MVRQDHVVALGLRDRRNVVFPASYSVIHACMRRVIVLPGLGEEVGSTVLIEEAQLTLAKREDTAEQS